MVRSDVTVRSDVPVVCIWPPPAQDNYASFRIVVVRLAPTCVQSTTRRAASGSVYKKIAMPRRCAVPVWVFEYAAERSRRQGKQSDAVYLQHMQRAKALFERWVRWVWQGMLLKERAESERAPAARAPSNCLSLSLSLPPSLAHMNQNQLRIDTMVKDWKTKVSRGGALCSLHVIQND